MINKGRRGPKISPLREDNIEEESGEMSNAESTPSCAIGVKGKTSPKLPKSKVKKS